MLYERIPGLVSVVITNYNQGSYLRDCLDSILQQTYGNWEIILIDDASTDSSLEEANQWFIENQSRFPIKNTFHLLSLPRNMGFAGALTTGYYLAKGEFIAVQDSDDISHPERLESQINFLIDHPEIDLVGTNYAAFEEGVPADLARGVNWIKYGENIAKVYKNGGHCVCHGTILFRGTLFDRVGGPTRRINGAEDYEFIVKCLNGKAKIENLPDVLYFYRIHPQQRSRLFYGKKNSDSHGK